MKNEKIIMADGGGGEKTRKLIAEHILPHFHNPILDQLDDAAVLSKVDGPICMTTDSYVVYPVEFPGGDIGKLSICGTVNDLACSGAKAKWLSMGLIIEEGFDIELLDRILASAAVAAEGAGVRIVTGDTKVIERCGSSEPSLMINTTGVGRLRENANLDISRIVPGDAVLINGNIADHGIAVMSAREGLEFQAGIGTDAAPLGSLIADLFDSGIDLKFLRDPTRGGLAGVAVDLVEDTGHTLELDEESIPVSSATVAAAGMLGLDPLNVANEGKVVVVVPDAEKEDARDLMRDHKYGQAAAIIGRFTDKPPVAELVTRIGGRRMISRPYGQELPRIC